MYILKNSALCLWVSTNHLSVAVRGWLLCCFIPPFSIF